MLFKNSAPLFYSMVVILSAYLTYTSNESLRKNHLKSVYLHIKRKMRDSNQILSVRTSGQPEKIRKSLLEAEFFDTKPENALYPKPNSPPENLNTDQTSSSFRRKKVLIIAEYRGGSTFAGEIFNQNLQASYLFEPLFLSRRFPTEPEVNAKNIEILKDYFDNCNYPTMDKYLLNETHYLNQNLRSFSMDKDYKNCALGNTCFLHKNRMMVDLTKIYPNYATGLSNQKQFQKAFKQKCLNLPITSAKAIRLYDLKHLEAFKDDPDFYAIYIIRDPRGMFNSKTAVVGDWHSSPPKWIRNNLEKQCENFEINVPYLQSANGNWLKNKLLAFRYEDLALSPNESLDQIYNFIGSSAGLEDLKEKITSMTSYSKDNVAPPVINKSVGTVQQTLFAYDTNRNSNKVVFKWVKKMPWSYVNVIQTSCGRELIEKLGYDFIEDSDEFEKLAKLPEGEGYQDRANDSVLWTLRSEWALKHLLDVL